MATRKKWRRKKWMPLKKTKGVGRPMTGRDWAMLRQYQAADVGECPKCKGRDVVPRESGTAVYKCNGCCSWLRMRSADCQFYVWKPGLEDCDDD